MDREVWKDHSIPLPHSLQVVVSSLMIRIQQVKVHEFKIH